MRWALVSLVGQRESSSVESFVDVKLVHVKQYFKEREKECGTWARLANSTKSIPKP